METSIITALGAGSGVDMAALTTQLVNAQFEFKTQRLTAKSDLLDRQISAASSIRSKISALAGALGDRVRTGDVAPTASVANSAIASISRMNAGVGATKGAFSLEVTALASAQSVASGSFANDATFTASTVTLNFGTVSGGTLTPDASRQPVEIEIAEGATLAEVASAINLSGSGVTAYVAQTTSGSRLVVKGASGEANAFTIQTSGDTALADLAWDPAATGTAERINSAANAVAKVDGLEYSSATNIFQNAIPGMAITVAQTNVGAPTSITFSNPTTAASSLVNDFVAAVNEILAELSESMDVQDGDIRRDTGAQALRRELLSITSKVLNPNAASGEPATLAAIGVRTNRDGTLSVDAAALTRALSDYPEQVSAMFTPGINGLYSEVDRISRNAMSVSNPASLGYSIQRYNSLKLKVADEKLDINEDSERLRTRLTAQFAATDARVAGFQSTMTFLENQIKAWNSDN